MAPCRLRVTGLSHGSTCAPSKAIVAAVAAAGVGAAAGVRCPLDAIALVAIAVGEIGTESGRIGRLETVALVGEGSAQWRVATPVCARDHPVDRIPRSDILGQRERLIRTEIETLRKDRAVVLDTGIGQAPVPGTKLPV